MKILHIPLNVTGSEQVGQERGFREVFGDQNYAQFDYLNLAGQNGNDWVNAALFSLVSEFEPDIIWAQLQETNIITPATWESLRALHGNLWLTTWSGDARTYVPPYLASILPYFDIFYNATDQKQLYSGYTRRYEFMPIAVDPEEVTRFKEVRNVPSVVFIGNHYGMDAFPNSRARYDTMVALTREFGNDFGVYGSGWPTGEINLLHPVDLKDQGSYYHAAKVVISMDHFNDMNYWSERRLWAIASGTPVVMEGHPDWHIYFDHMVHPFFNHSECIEAVHCGLKDEKTSGADFINHFHTWKQRAEQVRKDYLEKSK